MASALPLIGAAEPSELETKAIQLGRDLEAVGTGDYASKLALAYCGAVDPAKAEHEARLEIARCTARAHRLLAAQGLTHGAVSVRLATLFADLRYLYPDTSAGCDQAVADMNAALATLKPRLALAFGDLAIPAAEVRRMPADAAAAGKAGYRAFATGDRPGIYYPDLGHIRARPRWTLPSVAYHEVTPGHLLQAPFQAAANPDPLRLRYASAAFEAWAIYAEQLAAELGAHVADPLAELGYLHWRLFRMGRVVVDIGLHARGWSRDRALAELRNIQGPPVAFVGIEADVDRMITQPAAYAAQGIGALSYRRMRGENPRSPLFHRAVLEAGPWPFSLLPEVIQQARRKL